MKSTPSKASKSGKRVNRLKSILERQQDVDAKLAEITMTPVDITSITEDLIELTENTHSSPTSHTVAFNEGPLKQFKSAPVSAPTPSGQPITQSIELFDGLIDKELSKVAQQLDINEAELKAWVGLQIEVPAKTILHLLRMAQRLCLDPLCDEVSFTRHEDGSWQVFITIDGCTKLLNQHPQYNGLMFKQSDTLVDGIPEWMECAIYRKDRILPITAREYFTEVRCNTEIWQKMPRRMMRHRALQQCVRLAIEL